MRVFICLDGADGVGKSTVLNELQRQLCKIFNHDVVVSLKFPTKALLHSVASNKIVKASQFLDDFDEELRDIHKRDPRDVEIFLIDRSYISTATCQGVGKGDFYDIFEGEPVGARTCNEILESGVQIFMPHCDKIMFVNVSAPSHQIVKRIHKRIVNKVWEQTNSNIDELERHCMLEQIATIEEKVDAVEQCYCRLLKECPATFMAKHQFMQKVEALRELYFNNHLHNISLIKQAHVDIDRDVCVLSVESDSDKVFVSDVATEIKEELMDFIGLKSKKV